MKFIRKFLRFVPLVLTIQACDTINPKVVVKNDDTDIQKSGPYLETFYQLSADHNFDSLYSYFNVHDADTMLGINRLRVEQLLGKYKGLSTSEIFSQNTKDKSGTTIYYRVDLVCEFDSGSTSERFTFETVNGIPYFKSLHIELR